MQVLTIASKIVFSITSKALFCALLTSAFLSSPLVSQQAQSQGIDLLQYNIKKLFEPESQSLDQYRGKTTVIMFFEPESPFCFKQSKILGQLQSECGDFQAIGVGVNGNRRDLQKEARHLSASYPTYQINSKLQSAIGKVQGTPMMLVANKQGFYSTHLLGYQKLDALLPVLANAGMECT